MYFVKKKLFWLISCIIRSDRSAMLFFFSKSKWFYIFAPCTAHFLTIHFIFHEVHLLHVPYILRRLSVTSIPLSLTVLLFYPGGIYFFSVLTYLGYSSLDSNLLFTFRSPFVIRAIINIICNAGFLVKTCFRIHILFITICIYKKERAIQ